MIELNLKKKIRKAVIGRSEIKAVNRVLKTGLVSQAGRGPEVKKFEKEFVKYLGVKYAFATNSGTAALHSAVAALNLKEKDEIIVPALTFISTASVILQEKCTPIFADIEDNTFCIDSQDVVKRISKRTKAIIVVHIYGRPVDMGKIWKIAQKFNLKIIEDCAQAIGAEYKNKIVGSLGDISCFSFYQTKNMTTGEGGIVATNNKLFAKRIRSIIDHGLISERLETYNYDKLGYNYHPTEIQATLGRVQLKKINKLNKIRRINAEIYKKELADIRELRFQNDSDNIKHAYYCLTSLLPKKFAPKRDLLIKKMKENNAEVNLLYPIPLNKTKLFYSRKISCPIAESVAKRLINFYTNPGVEKRDIKKVAEIFKKFYKSL